jgi:methanogenic corrinoid protein MtbC1
MSRPPTPRVAGRADLVERFVALLAVGDEEGAVAMVTRLRDEHVPAESIMLDVVGAAQVQVGRLWADNQWSVAREHAATAISESAVAVLAAGTDAGADAGIDTAPSRGTVVVACVDGEWHALPVQMLAGVLRLRGWRVDYLGTNVPGPRLVAHLHTTEADAVALSCMLPSRLPRAHAAITACKAAGVPVIAGGRGFGAEGRYARQLGADAWEARADSAADRLADDWPPRTSPAPPYAGGDEYYRLVARRSALIDGVSRRSAADNDLSPALAEVSLGDSLIDMAGTLVDVVAAAVYVDDPAIVADFTAWMTGVLAARGAPGGLLITGLTVLRDLLPDCPRARVMISRSLHEICRTP